MTEREKAIKEFALFIKEFHPACTSEGVELDLFRKVLALLNEQKELLKEQEAMNWINVKDGLPNENGSYLVVYNVFQYALIDVKRFAKDLYSADKYDFPNEHRPGWYEYDDEYGYIERNDITHWMPLPNLPEKGR